MKTENKLKLSVVGTAFDCNWESKISSRRDKTELNGLCFGLPCWLPSHHDNSLSWQQRRNIKFLIEELDNCQRFFQASAAVISITKMWILFILLILSIDDIKDTGCHFKGVKRDHRKPESGFFLPLSAQMVYSLRNFPRAH